VGPNPQGTVFTFRERENEIFRTGFPIGSVVSAQPDFLCMGVADINPSPQGTDPLTVPLIFVGSENGFAGERASVVGTQTIRESTGVQVENRDAAAIGADIELLVPRFCQSGHLVSGQAVFFGAMYNLFGAGIEMEQPFPVPDPDTSVRRYFHAAGIRHAVACYADDAVGSIEISDSDILNDDPNAIFGVYIHRLHMVVDGTMTLMQQRNGDAHRVHSGSHFERQQAGFFAGS